MEQISRRNFIKKAAYAGSALAFPNIILAKEDNLETALGKQTVKVQDLIDQFDGKKYGKNIEVTVNRLDCRGEEYDFEINVNGKHNGENFEFYNRRSSNHKYREFRWTVEKNGVQHGFTGILGAALSTVIFDGKQYTGINTVRVNHLRKYVQPKIDDKKNLLKKLDSKLHEIITHSFKFNFTDDQCPPNNEPKGNYQKLGEDTELKYHGKLQK